MRQHRLSANFDHKSSQPALILRSLASSTSSCTHSFASPTHTTVDNAMHLCPAAPKAAPAVQKATLMIYKYIMNNILYEPY